MDTVFEIPSVGEFDEEAAERAPLAGFHLGDGGPDDSRETWFLIRSWSRELRLYQNLARHLGDDRRIVTIAPPRGTRKEDFPRTVERWRDFCLERLRPQLGSNPRVLLGGWSFGGVLALEMGRQLEKDGTPVALVTMLDTRLPKAHPTEQRIARSLPHALANHATRFFETPSEGRGEYLRERLAWQFYHARRKAGEWNAARRNQPAPVYQRPDGRTSEPRDVTEMTPLQKALWVAYLKYQPRECTVPVAQFWCDDSCLHTGDASLGWARYLRGPFVSLPIPGGHLTMFDDPHAEALAQTLGERLASLV